MRFVLQKPPFLWTESDLARLTPGSAVIWVLVHRDGSLSPNLHRVAHVYMDYVSFPIQSGFMTVRIDECDPGSIVTRAELAALELPQHTVELR